MELQKIGRYEIQRELGRGGMGIVYLASDPVLKRKVAIKVLKKGSLAQEGFLREAEIIASLEHPFIVPIYDFGTEDGISYIVMRLMLGGTLTERIKKAGAFSFPIEEVVPLLKRMASALDTVHQQDIVHRDLKPDNILYDRYQGAFLTDFGIALTTESKKGKDRRVVGTPAYMSPEQISDGEIDQRADVYALGIIAFELLTGQQPYMGATVEELLTQHVVAPVPLVLDIRSDLPPASQNVLEKAMAKNPADRYESAGEFVSALTTAMREEFTEISNQPYSPASEDLFVTANGFITVLNQVVTEQMQPNGESPNPHFTVTLSGPPPAVTASKIFARASNFLAILDEVNRRENAVEELKRKQGLATDKSDVRASMLLSWQMNGQSFEQNLSNERDRVIGRQPNCDIYLPDVRVSRRHGLIRWDSSQGHFSVQNLSRVNKIYRNDIVSLLTEDQKAIKAGDHFRVGPVKMLVKSVMREGVHSSASQVVAQHLDALSNLRVSCPQCEKKVGLDESDCPWCGASLVGGLSLY